MLYLQDESASAPFAAGTNGAVAEVQLRVPPTEHSYACWLKLSYPEGDHRERERIKQLAGSGARDREGRSVDTGLAIPVRLVVERIDRDGSSSVLDGVFTNHEPWASGFGSFSKMITRVQLTPGHYRARIEALENIRELEAVPVAFGIGIPGNEK